MFYNAPADLGFIAYDANDIFRILCPPNKIFIEVKNENSGDSSSFVVRLGSLITFFFYNYPFLFASPIKS
jgi:hypothetical protein